MKKLYVGNISFGTTESSLETAFSAFGEVHSVTIIKDRDTGRSKGFGFVEMDDSAATTAIDKLNNTELDGRTIKVNEARPKESGGGSRSGGRREYGG